MSGLNRKKEHLYIFPEDNAYKDMVQCFENECAQIRCLKPFNGYIGKLKEKIGRNVDLPRLNEYSFILILIDYDNKMTNYDSEYPICQKTTVINQVKNLLQDRVKQENIFVMGIEFKESENLKKFFNASFEEIGQILFNDLKNNKTDNWSNEHLQRNINELKKMKEVGICKFLGI
ncbi:hypothetical protein OFO12_01055 [Campylobacter sp. JMF_04 NA10]|uniref:hypothetical protein n=1 Tax=Campylobacter sp. JMF_04 NA10 TaxID=2983824 RepID=UPI0022E9CE8F|nr:hypothetical protein [Campylobacter sp. JMF_04 NA10]MDA3075957.1 hypothetical protein [Campylobacter sp. JMF_04 NA10]